MLRTHTLGTVHPLLLLPFFFLSSIYLFLPFSGPVLCPVPSRPDSFIFLCCCCCNLLKCNVVLLYHCHSRLLDFDKSLLMVSNIKLSDEIPFSSPFPHFVAYIFHAPSPHTHTPTHNCYASMSHAWAKLLSFTPPPVPVPVPGPVSGLTIMMMMMLGQQQQWWRQIDSLLLPFALLLLLWWEYVFWP